MRRNSWRRALAICVGVVTGTNAFGAIQYRIDGGTAVTIPPGTTPYSINVGNVTSFTTLNIFESDLSIIDEDVRPLVITGNWQGGQLRVLVAPDGTSFPTDSTTELDKGCRDFGGLTFGSNTDLQNNSSVVISADRDVTGAVTAGQLFRIDARRDITGNLTASSPSRCAQGQWHESRGTREGVRSWGSRDHRACGRSRATSTVLVVCSVPPRLKTMVTSSPGL